MDSDASGAGRHSRFPSYVWADGVEMHMRAVGLRRPVLFLSCCPHGEFGPRWMLPAPWKLSLGRAGQGRKREERGLVARLPERRSQAVVVPVKQSAIEVEILEIR